MLFVSAALLFSTTATTCPSDLCSMDSGDMRLSFACDDPVSSYYCTESGDACSCDCSGNLGGNCKALTVGSKFYHISGTCGCPAGSYGPDADCTDCDDGHFCQGGEHKEEHVGTCAAGTYQTQAPSSSQQRICSPCTADHFCEGGTHKEAHDPVCSPGHYQTQAPSSSQQRICSPCEADHFCEGGIHIDEHEICGNGQVLSGASATSSGTCVDCGDGKYKAGMNRATSCSDQEQCGDGQYLSGASDSSAGSCQNCGDGKYNSGTNRDPGCYNQEICGNGQYLTGASSSAEGSCATCQTGKYKDSGNNRATECEDQMQCPSGQKLVGASSSNAGTCTDCPDNKWKLGNNRVDSCAWHNTCNAGHYLSGADEDSAGSCVVCPSTQYTPNNDGHSYTSCSDKNKCNTGYKLVGSSSTSFGSCEACTGATFVDAANGHRATSCTAQPTCPNGQELTGASTTTQGTCEDCGSQQYKNSGDDRNSCSPWRTCPPGQYLFGASATNAGSCRDCAAGTYTAFTDSATDCTDQNSCGDGQQLDQRYKRVKIGHECTSTDNKQGTTTMTLEACYQLALASGKTVFSYGTGSKAGWCYAENTADATCTEGWEVDQYDTYVVHGAGGTCADCATGKFRSGNGRGTCSSWNTCGDGQHLDGESSSSGGTCTNCPANHYKDGTNSATSCSAHNLCGKGQYLSGADNDSRGSCLSCTSGYQDSNSHRQTGCKSWKSCNSDQYRSGHDAENEGSCYHIKACGNNQYSTGGGTSYGTCSNCASNTWKYGNNRAKACTACSSVPTSGNSQFCNRCGKGSCVLSSTGDDYRVSWTASSSDHSICRTSTTYYKGRLGVRTYQSWLSSNTDYEYDFDYAKVSGDCSGVSFYLWDNDKNGRWCNEDTWKVHGGGHWRDVPWDFDNDICGVSLHGSSAY